MTTYATLVALAMLIGALVGILLTALVMIHLTRRGTWFDRWRGMTVSSEEERQRVEDQRNRERWYEYQRRREDALRRAV